MLFGGKWNRGIAAMVAFVVLLACVVPASAQTPEAVDSIIETAKGDKSGHVRGQALFWLGQKAGKKINKEDGIQRYKGLGEMDAKELWETTMDPSVRVLRQITLDDAAAADELFSILMGEDVEARRSFITRNAKDVRFLDV